MNRLRFLSILSICLGVPATAPGGAVKLWSRTDPGPDPAGGGAGATVAMDAAGNVIVACNSRGTASSQFTVMKFAAATGTQLWKKTFSGEGHAAAVAVDATGDVFVTGSGPGTGRITVYVTAKLAAATGVPLWEKRYDSPATDPFGGGDLQNATHLALDPQGAVVVTGTAYGGGDNMSNIHTIKYSAADGAVVWSRTFAGPGDYRDVPAGLGLDGSGNVLLLGETGPMWGTGTPLLAKYAAATGAVLWEKSLPPPEDFDELWPSRLACDAAGNAFVTATAVANVSQWYRYTARYSAAGTLTWEVDPYSMGNFSHTEIAATADGHAFTGDYSVSKFASSGADPLWVNFFGEPNPPATWYEGTVGSVVTTPQGAVFSAGTVRHSLDHRGDDLMIIRHHPQTGAPLWLTTYDGGSTTESLPDPRAFAVSGENRFAVVYAVSRGGDPEFDTVCFGLTSPLEEWRLARLGTTANAGDAADHADPDKDGIPNLVEWACLLDPVEQNPAPLTVALTSPGSMTATYTLSRTALTAGALCAVEWSASLGPDAVWSTQTITTSMISENASSRIMQARLSTADGIRKFVRLRVSAP